MPAKMTALTEEQVELLRQLGESLKNDPSLYRHILGFFGVEKDEPTMAGMLKYVERFIQHTMPGLYDGSWSGPSGPYDIHISFKARQEKPTT